MQRLIRTKKGFFSRRLQRPELNSDHVAKIRVFLPRPNGTHTDRPRETAFVPVRKQTSFNVGAKSTLYNHLTSLGLVKKKGKEGVAKTPLLANATDKPPSRLMVPPSFRWSCFHFLSLVLGLSQILSKLFDPYVDNGGTVVGLAGKDYCIIASDTRLSEQYTIRSRSVSRFERPFVKKNRTEQQIFLRCLQLFDLDVNYSTSLQDYYHHHNS